MATTAMFSLVHLVFNTITNPTNQDEQVACFQNVAAHLEPGGCLGVEAGDPGSGGCRPASPSARSP